MSDPREDILVRLLAVAASLDPVEARRNEMNPPDNLLKTGLIVLLDGEEVAVDEQPRGNRQPLAPTLILMTPEVQLRVEAKAKDIGTRLNDFRRRLIHAVLTDSQLLALTANGRNIRYRGSGTVTERGRSMEGGIGVAFGITYVLRPGDLVETTA